MNTYRLFIDGQFRDASHGRTFADVNPATGQTVAQVCEASVQDVDGAVQAAKRAASGPWRNLGFEERAAALARIADGIEARFDDFLAAEIADTGKPRSLASRIDIPRGAANFRIFSHIAANTPGDAYQSTTRDGRGALNYSIRKPIGVVGVICPWNLPLLLMTWKVAPALAAGNCVVVKPSEETPGTATLLAEVIAEAGIPNGVYNVVHGFGPGSAGEALVQHPDVRAITFTGESRTGQTIMRSAAEDIKKLSFELGGKNPAVIFADCDFDAAVAGTARSVFMNCGQVCLCSERVYVERPIYERFVEALKAEAEAIVSGDPHDPGTSMGPLISAEHRDKVLAYYALAREEGATVVTGGGIPQLDAPWSEGFYVQPTLWTGLGQDARCVREEIFGPACAIQPFDTEDEALALANDSPYGLAAAIWTRDLTRAHRVAHQVKAGLVWVNTWFLRDLRTPFGGVGLSGLGREGGLHSMRFYSELHNICIKL